MSHPGVRSALLPIAAWGVALLVVFMPGLSGWVAVGLAVCAALCAVAVPRQYRVPVVMALLAALAVAGVVAVQAPARERFADAATGAGGFTGRITSKVEPAWSGAWHFTAEVSGRERDISGPVSALFVGERPPDLDLGAEVELRGAIDVARPGEKAIVSVRLARPPTVTNPPRGVLELASHARRVLVERSSEFPGAGGRLLPGLAVGETSAVDEVLDAEMKATGLSHLTAVSGANCAIVVGAAFAVAAVCGARRWVRVAAGLIALAGFVILVTPEASVIRAAGMCVVGLVALVTGRMSQGMGVLCTAVMALLIMDPWLSTSLGFALSVAASSALILLARPVADTLMRVMPVPAAYLIAVPLSAQLACAPLLVIISPTLSPYSVLANVIAGPAAPLATIAGMLACLLAWIPGVGWALTAVAWVPAQWVGSTAERIAALPAVRLPWWEGIGGAFALAVLTAAATVFLIRVRGRAPRSAALVVLALAAGIGCGTWTVRTVVAPAVTPSGWVMAACNVGQGDAVVFRGSTGVMLVDTGREPGPLAECLTRLGISHIDVLVLSHFDADHAGGVGAVLGRVTTVVHGPWSEPAHGALLRDLQDEGAALHPARIGDEIDFGDARVRVLWPPARGEPGNDASVVTEWAGRGLRVVSLGDLSAIAQQGVLSARTLRPPYDVVKVAHHGSGDQEPRLYAVVRAPLAVISVGADNDYGHPRADALAMLTATGSTILRTDTAGLLLVIPTDEGLRVWTEHR